MVRLAASLAAKSFDWADAEVTTIPLGATESIASAQAAAS